MAYRITQSAPAVEVVGFEHVTSSRIPYIHVRPFPTRPRGTSSLAGTVDICEKCFIVIKSIETGEVQKPFLNDCLAQRGIGCQVRRFIREVMNELGDGHDLGRCVRLGCERKVVQVQGRIVNDSALEHIGILLVEMDHGHSWRVPIRVLREVVEDQDGPKHIITIKRTQVPSLNQALIKHWINSRGKRSFQKQRKAPYSGDIRLIDCVNMSFTKHHNPKVPYAALSYLWEAETSFKKAVDEIKKGHQELQEPPPPTLQKHTSSSLRPHPVHSRRQRHKNNKNHPGRPTNTGHLCRASLPDHLKSAIILCRNLNIRYLWVDRVCIRQDPEPEQYYFDRMGDIYAGADITISLALKRRDGAAIPGLSLPTGPRESTFNVEPKQVHRTYAEMVRRMSTPDDITHLKQSLWSTRGWTLQELFFGEVRIVITDSDVMYYADQFKDNESSRWFVQDPESWEPVGCDGIVPSRSNDSLATMVTGTQPSGWESRVSFRKGSSSYSGTPRSSCTESLSTQRNEGGLGTENFALPANSKFTERESFWFDGARAFPPTPEEGFVRFLELAVEYSRRELTVGGDVMRAFAGIIHFLRELWNTQFIHHHPENNFLKSLLWMRNPAVPISPSNEVEPCAEFRASLPSWAWHRRRNIKYLDPLLEDVDCHVEVMWMRDDGATDKPSLKLLGTWQTLLSGRVLDAEREKEVESVANKVGAAVKASVMGPEGAGGVFIKCSAVRMADIDLNARGAEFYSDTGSAFDRRCWFLMFVGGSSLRRGIVVEEDIRRPKRKDVVWAGRVGAGNLDLKGQKANMQKKVAKMLFLLL